MLTTNINNKKNRESDINKQSLPPNNKIINDKIHPTHMIIGRKLYLEDGSSSIKICEDNEDDIEFNDKVEPVSSKLNSKKVYKYNKNNDEEISQILSDKNLNTNSNFTVHDLRFFDNNSTNFSNTSIFIHHSNPNPDIMGLLDKSECNLIFTESTLQNKNLSQYINILKESHSHFFVLTHKELEENYFKNYDSEKLSKFENLSLDEIFELNLEEGYKKSLYIINEKLSASNSNFSKIKRVIIYIEVETSNAEVFLLLKFLSKIKKENHCNKNIQMILLTDDSISFALEAKMNIILLPKSLLTKKGVGLLPLEKSVISTKGFKWDIEKWETSFGHINLSTSNEFNLEEEVKLFVESGSVILTAEIDPKIKFSTNI